MSNETTIEGYLQNCKKYKKHNYKELNSQELEYLHSIDLKMLEEIIRIFNSHKIKYCAVGGDIIRCIY